MRRLHDTWMQYWFSPTDPIRLSLCRILFYGGVLLFYLPTHYAGWGSLPSSLHEPRTLVGLLGVPVVSSSALLAMEVVWKVSLATSCIGFLTRPSAVIAAVLGMYLLALPNDFGKVNHNDQPLALVMCVLAIARSGDVLSVDRWVARRRGVALPLPSGEYRWPVRAAWLILAMVFFAAGVAKLRFGGIPWLGGAPMQYFLVSHQYPYLSHPPWTDWGLAIAQSQALCAALSTAAVVTEAGFPLALCHPWARFAFPVGALLMQVGIRALMGPHFEQYVFVYLFFVPWDRLWHTVSQGKASVTR